MNRSLTYRLGELRGDQNDRIRRLIAGGDVDDWAWRNEYREIEKQFATIGAWGNMLRVSMLPRAWEVWGWRAALRMFDPRVDYTPYHRLRMAAAITVDGLLTRTRLALAGRRRNVL